MKLVKIHSLSRVEYFLYSVSKTLNILFLVMTFPWFLNMLRRCNVTTTCYFHTEKIILLIFSQCQKTISEDINFIQWMNRCYSMVWRWICINLYHKWGRIYILLLIILSHSWHKFHIQQQNTENPVLNSSLWRYLYLTLIQLIISRINCNKRHYKMGWHENIKKEFLIG